MDPQVAGSLILALGGVALTALGVVALRVARGPVIAAARLDSLDKRMTEEGERTARLIGEAHDAAIDARRLATRRAVKGERRVAPASDDDPVDVPLAPSDGRPRIVGADGQTYIPGETLQELAARRAREARGEAA